MEANYFKQQKEKLNIRFARKFNPNVTQTRTILIKYLSMVIKNL